MPNTITPELYAQIFSQESDDPFLTLITLSHSSFPQDVTLVNNKTNVTSRGTVFEAFPMKIRLPVDDGETMGDIAIEFDNVSLELINEIRSVTDFIQVKMELILASIPDEVQMVQEDLKIINVTYNRQNIRATLMMDNFLNTAMTSEKYTPTTFPGLFE